MKTHRLAFQYVILILISIVTVHSQTTTEKRIIEVTGSAETLITPNEFTFKITLLERVENKQKVTIEMQETNLKQELAALGVDVQKDLTIFDLSSAYIRQRRLKDTLGSKDYRLKLRELEKIEKLQELADRLNLSRLDLIDSTHSELTRFRRETKMEAVKAARAKAEYMLGAIGERVGKAFFVKEIDDDDDTLRQTSLPNITNSVSSNSTYSYSSSDSNASLKFSQIKLRYSVLARFEIE